MRILLAGGTGFIGRNVSERLREAGHSVILLSTSRAGKGYYRWNPLQGEIDLRALKDIEVVINLSGAGVANRPWTPGRKRLLYDSRILSTRVLVDALSQLNEKPRLLINSSAIGYYGHRPATPVNEQSDSGKSFLADLTRDWEGEASRVRESGISLAVLRTGIVLGKGGGSMPKLLLPFRLGMNVMYGRGNQFMSWIHIEDVCKVIMALVSNDIPAETYNITAPNALPQRYFNRQLLQIMGRRALPVHIPKAFLRVVMGEMSSILTNDQQVIPARLLQHNFSFRFPDLQGALIDILHDGK